MKNDWDIELNEGELDVLGKQIVENEIASGTMEYACPDCGKSIQITGEVNTCSCGFVLTVQVGDTEF